MTSLRAVSLTLLFLETILLVIPSFFGFYFAIAGMYSFVFDTDDQLSIMDFVAFLMLLASLISFWKILLWISDKRQNDKKKFHTVWWNLSLIGVALTIISPILYQQTNVYGLMWFVFGYLFLPTCCHLLFEAKRQVGTAYGKKLLQK